MVASHECQSVPECMGVRCHTPPFGSVLKEAGLPEHGVRLQGGGSLQQVRLQQETYGNWQAHIDADREVKEVVLEFKTAQQLCELGDEYDVQSQLTEIRSRLVLALSRQELTDTTLPEAVRAEAMGEPLQTINQLIGE